MYYNNLSGESVESKTAWIDGKTITLAEDADGELMHSCADTLGVDPNGILSIVQMPDGLFICQDPTGWYTIVCQAEITAATLGEALDWLWGEVYEWTED